MTSIGSRLAEERRRLGLDQEEFGAIGGVKRNAQSAYEKNKRPLNTDYLDLLNKSGVDVVYVVTGHRLSKNGTQVQYKEVGEALNAVIDVQEELGINFDSAQIKSAVGFAWKAQASRDQILAFVRGAFEFVGKALPEDQDSE